MDVRFVGSVELIIGSGRYSNWRLLSTFVLVSNVTFSLYIPVSYAPLDLQVIFHSSDKFLILRIISTVKSNRRLSKCMMTFFYIYLLFSHNIKNISFLMQNLAIILFLRISVTVSKHLSKKYVYMIKFQSLLDILVI